MLKITKQQKQQLKQNSKQNLFNIIFKTGKRYLYSNVSKSEFKAIIDAESIGSAFTTIIKKDTNKTFKPL